MLAQGPESILIEALVQSGPFALILVAIAMEWLFTKGHVRDLRQQVADLQGEVKEARDDIRRNNEVTRDILMPVASQALAAINAFNEEMTWKRRSAS